LEKWRPWIAQRAAVVGIETDNEHDLSKIEADVILILGGDGTLLSVARLVEGLDIPILGVNLGSLGFLTEITRDELYSDLERIFKNEFREDPRLMLKSEVRRKEKIFSQPAVLNDITLHKGALSKLIKLEITIGGQFVTSLRADGLIIASPTGSTAYSLSSGGPIVHPSVDAIVLTPISPHMLTNRPIIVPSTAEIDVVLKSEEGGPIAMLDGQEVFPLEVNDVVHVQASEKKLILISSPHRNYYQVLRQKLKWGEG
ncbi:MAG TPA: NAD(+)/NADH kinase, partial [Candidatus Manganitrophaceae bacterium]|nr:NAD(+)/NADH kinase [Candidatus Manganitrophaceae bacterium]